ncbi:hypothetical protein AMS68_002192 [Peltaster fructicola]|uniref:beta-glucosidase n=1 Tax=Peltaster fructicola TaxID=286661 RepID=A0A6H0XPW6_9PEZI|nr:hypothetical protein AMS68_002192 [Peltaster fructicola]
MREHFAADTPVAIDDIHNHHSYTFEDAVKDVQQGRRIDGAVAQLVSSLTDEECLWLLDGDPKFYDGLRTMFEERYNIRPFVMGRSDRLQIPGIRFSDGPRGVCIGNSTAFPVSTARAATFDTSIERRIGDAIGKEAKAQGANLFAGVCINLPRHPAWGRSQETYGDDPLVLGAFGAALTHGVQQHVMACVKHFALNSMENARFRVDVKIDDAALHEVYLPHFKRVIDAGVASVMSAYNSVNGEWAGQSKFLLADVLRDLWKFDGFVMSDFVFGLRDAALSLKNGLDLEAPFQQQRLMHLRQGIAKGEASWEDARRACFRILKKQLQFHTSTATSVPDQSVVFCAEHRALARETAARSVVLLKNDNVQGIPLLPLQLNNVRRIAIIGRLASADNTGDMGSSRVISPKVVTLVEALQEALPDVEVVMDDADDIDQARATAQEADLAICIVGYSAHDEGEYVIPSLPQDPELYACLPPTENDMEEEVAARLRGDATPGSAEGLVAGAGGDRKSLQLRSQDEAIVTAVLQVNPRTIMTVVCAGAVLMHELIQKVPTALITWYAGSEGGHGLTDVLLGKIDASGRLPFSIPKSEKHLSFFQIDAREITYDRWHGQRLLDKLGVEAAYPFGYGLSYSKFELSDFTVSTSTSIDPHEALLVQLSIKNTGHRRGRYVAQAYAMPHLEGFPGQVLVGFLPVDLEPQEQQRVRFPASIQPISQWKEGKFVLPQNLVDFEVGAFAGDRQAVRTQLYI